MFGVSAHMVNATTAIAIACGQDGAYFPSMFAATVGGGTSFGTTARECLETLGCYGSGKSKRFAEIIAATALAGEISPHDFYRQRYLYLCPCDIWEKQATPVTAKV
jgi:hydroxymethylglutaryl-CoA reductase